MALISDLLGRGATYSFEFFPPKNDAEQATLVRTLRELEPLAPSFVSVTYRGGRESRQRTHDLVAGMLRTTTLTPMAHLVCVAHTRLELAEILVAFRKAGVENLMALGGDPPTDPSAGPGELLHAVELVELARAIGGFSIGVAAHPAGHPASPDMAVRPRPAWRPSSGWPTSASPSSSSRSRSTWAWCEDLAARGVHKPVLPGIMPVTALRSVPRMAEMGAALPAWAVARLEEAAARGGDDAVRQAGVGHGHRAVREAARRRAPRACTSTRSTAPARPGRSTPHWGSSGRTR